MAYQVGQILYVINHDSTQVVPIQVIEQVTRRTLAGEEVSYMITVPGKTVKPAALDKIKGEIFVSLEETRDYLRNNALAAIENVITRAMMLSESFPTESEEPISAVAEELSEPEAPPSPESEDSDVVLLPDGTQAKINLPASIDDAIAKQVQNEAPV